MTFTRRRTPIGAAATTAAALPAVAVADVTNGEVMVDQGHRSRDVVGCTGRWRAWFGGYDFIETVRALGAADLTADCELVDFREIA
jgi:hypothetical protein